MSVYGHRRQLRSCRCRRSSTCATSSTTCSASSAPARSPTSYAGLGLDRGLTVGLRSQLSAISGYQQTITQVGVRLDLMQTALTQFGSVTQTDQELDPAVAVRAERRDADAGSDQHARPARPAGRHAQHRRRRPLPVLRPQRRPDAGRDHRPHPQRRRPAAGLKQVIDERRQADLGASGLGRLRVGAPGGDRGVARPRMPVAVRLQARRRHHDHRGRDRDRADRRAAGDDGRSRAGQSERRRHRHVHASRCRTAPPAT